MIRFPRGPASGRGERQRVFEILAALRKLAKVVSVDEFELDLRPIETIDLTGDGAVPVAGDSTPALGTANGEQIEADPDLGEEAPGPQVIDFISTISEILVENSRLEKISQELRPVSSQDDEFARFARKAITILDGLDRIILLGREHTDSPEMAGWLKSIEALNEKVLRILESHDLHVVSCVGQKVDFSMHDVIEYRRTSDYPHQTIISEISKGIVFRNRVLRDAKVVVALNDGEEQDAP